MLGTILGFPIAECSSIKWNKYFQLAGDYVGVVFSIGLPMTDKMKVICTF